MRNRLHKLSPCAPQLLESDIQPSLTKLRRQCEEYNEYNALQSQRDRLLKFLCAYDHVESNKWVVRTGRNMGRAQDHNVVASGSA